MRTYHDFLFKRKADNAEPVSPQRRDRVTIIMVLVLATIALLLIIGRAVQNVRDALELKKAERALVEFMASQEPGTSIQDIELISKQDTYMQSLNDSLLHVIQAREIVIKGIDELQRMGNADLSILERKPDKEVKKTGNPQIDSLLMVANNRLLDLMDDIPKTGVEVFRIRLTEMKEAELVANAQVLPKKGTGYFFICKLDDGTNAFVVVRHAGGKEGYYSAERLE